MACNDPLCNQQHIVDHKHTVFVVAKNAQHRKQVADALLSVYNVMGFDTIAAVFTALREIEPAIVIVDEDTPPPYNGYEFVNQLREKRETKDLPAILLLSENTPAKIFAATECRANDWLIKPYLRSTLIKTISKSLNTVVEQAWNDLPPVQTKTLKGTLEMFNNIADNVANGSSIDYLAASDSCLPLIEAVNSNNFSGILLGVKDHDNYTFVHSLRVATMLTLFGNAISLPLEDQKILTTGGLLHDVGKMAIPHHVLNKPGKLTTDEFDVMKSHVITSVQQLSLDGNIPQGIITIAGQHHEKLDGTGYPYGLEGSKLNKLARMAAIVDIFSALTDRRVYKAPMLAEEALALMTDQMSHHIDIPLLGMFRERFLDALATIGS